MSNSLQYILFTNTTVSG